MSKIVITRLAVILLCCSLLLPACGDFTASPTATPSAPQATPLPEAMVTFRVTIPSPPNPGETITLNLLDEVTGLALNPQPFAMQAEDAQHYSISLPLTIGSVVKYRYTRAGSVTLLEHISDGRPVRYRLYPVDGPALVNDVVSRWTDTTFSGATGRISGQVVDAASGAPLANLMVAAGGAQALTSTDGSFLLEGLPPGNHWVIAYAMDGAFYTFKQEATVAAQSTTPALLRLNAAPMVTVSFTVATPADTPAGAFPRFAGNLLQLGNTFADLAGGVSTLATRMPVMSRLPDGRFTIVLSLPAGADLRYKYTLGDGLWSAEHDSTGDFRIRQYIVPANGGMVEDRVETWKSGASAPITFDVNVPANTPADEVISIQFNPGFSWTEPIPMWKASSNRWRFTLTSPLDRIGEFGYRYCREDQCGSADETQTMGSLSRGHPVGTSAIAQNIVDDVLAWAWLNNLPPATVPNVSIAARGSSFVAGVEFQSNYHPSWGTRWPRALNGVASLSANWVFLTPTWSFTRQNYPVLETVPGRDILWPEEANLIAQARSLNLNVAVFPNLHFPGSAADWWQTAGRDFAWWTVWFERYRTYSLHFADLAARSGATALVLGGEDILPALPGGALADGSPSGAPGDAEQRWRTLLAEVRQRFGGVVIWALPYPQGVQTPPPFLDAVDAVYILWSAPLATTSNAADADLQAEAARLLDAALQPYQATINKPVVIGISYPSADGAITGCAPAPAGGCLPFSDLSRPKDDVGSATVDLNEQASAYNAMLVAVNARPWIAGIVARGYYPPVTLLDKSISVNGKPASGVLWYWFPRLLGKQ